jgi:hypothetical protein
MKWRKKDISTALLEIHEYTRDIERITILRDKAMTNEEKEQYAVTIDIMQKVLIILNEKLTLA